MVIIDGDHNYFTVSEELRLIAERAAGAALPLLLFHDVGWPHARRDDYYAAERIPEADRRPLAGDARRHFTRTSPGCGRWASLPALGGARRRSAQRCAHRGRGLRRRTRGPAAGRRPGVLRLRGGLGERCALRGEPSPRSSTPGTAIRCSGGSRTTACMHLALAHARLVALQDEQPPCAPGGAAAAAARVERVLGRGAAVPSARPRPGRAEPVGDLQGGGPPGARRLALSRRRQWLTRRRGSVSAPRREPVDLLDGAFQLRAPEGLAGERVAWVTARAASRSASARRARVFQSSSSLCMSHFSARSMCASTQTLTLPTSSTDW